METDGILYKNPGFNDYSETKEKIRGKNFKGDSQVHFPFITIQVHLSGVLLNETMTKKVSDRHDNNKRHSFHRFMIFHPSVIIKLDFLG